MGASSSYGRPYRNPKHRRGPGDTYRSKPLSVLHMLSDASTFSSPAGPGSCLFLFEGKQTIHAGDSSYKSHFIGSARVFRYLHCGDFRASPQHVLHPAVRGKKIDQVYLDTTYLDPRVSTLGSETEGVNLTWGSTWPIVLLPAAASRHICMCGISTEDCCGPIPRR